ncbi:hypothetical protein DFJ74DRAFT_739584 [Hyaloraphidium curvatum]|nr:hypothetical protein DFJ74DRAFT_739584 [Hyaloraphidium curvatum]
MAPLRPRAAVAALLLLLATAALADNRDLADPAWITISLRSNGVNVSTPVLVRGSHFTNAPWPANADMLPADANAWPVIHFGAACPNSSYPTLPYSALAGTPAATPGTKYVAVVHRLVEVFAACFSHAKYAYATGVPPPYEKPSAVLFYGDIDSDGGQVTSRFGVGLPEFFPALPMTYVGNASEYSELAMMFGSPGYANGTVPPGAVPYVWYARGADPPVVYEIRPVEPSMIVGPFLLGVFLLIFGLCNYLIFKVRKMREQGMSYQEMRASFFSVFYEKPLGDLTDEELLRIFPPSDVVSSADCPICLSSMTEPPPDKVDSETAKDAIARAAGQAAMQGGLQGGPVLVDYSGFARVDGVREQAEAAEAAEKGEVGSVPPDAQPANPFEEPAPVAADASLPAAAADASIPAAPVDAAPPATADAPPPAPAADAASLAPTSLSPSTVMPPVLLQFAGCSHLFHQECARAWVESKRKATRFGTAEVRWQCPVCRADHPAWIEAHPDEARAAGEEVEMDDLGRSERGEGRPAGQAQAQMASPLSELPEEILERILEWLLPVGAAAGSHWERLAALAGVRRASRRLREAADGFVWRALEIPGFSYVPGGAGAAGAAVRRAPTGEELLAGAAGCGRGVLRELRFGDPSALPRKFKGALLLPRLAALDLAGLTPKELGDAALAALLGDCHALRSLGLAYSTELTDAAVAALREHQKAQRRAGRPVLERLDLSCCNRLSFNAIAGLVEVLGRDLRSLKLFGIPGRGADAAFQAIARFCPRIETLCMGETGLGEARISAGNYAGKSAWYKLGRECADLAHLNVAGCSGVTTDCLLQLGRGRAAARDAGIACAPWTMLGLGKLGWKAGFGPDASDDGEGSADDDSGAVVPVVTRSVMQLLFPEDDPACAGAELALDLSNLVLGVPVLEYLAAHSGVAARLASLDLTSTTLFVPNVAFSALASSTHLLCPIVARFPALRTLSIAQLVPPTTDDLASTLASCSPRLEKLDLRGSYLLTDAGLASLHPLPLSEVDLKACEKVTDAGVRALLSGRAARSLNLGLLPGVSDAALRELDAHELGTLKLSGCTAISDAGIRHLSLSSLPSLTLLCFHNLRLLSPPALCSLFSLAPNLVSLNLFGCDLADDDVLCELGRACPKLESLCASGCAVGDRGVRGLVAGCGRLRTLYLGYLVGSWNADEMDGGVERDGEEMRGMEILPSATEEEDAWGSDDGSAFWDGDGDEEGGEGGFEGWFGEKLSLDPRPPPARGDAASSAATRYSGTTAASGAGSSRSYSGSVGRSMAGSYRSGTSFASPSASSFCRPPPRLTDRGAELALSLPFLRILDLSGSDVTLDFDVRAPTPLEWLKVRCCRRLRGDALERLVAASPELRDVEMVGSGVEHEARARIARMLDERD